jgi:type IV pilus assembly protein PilV
MNSSHERGEIRMKVKADSGFSMIEVLVALMIVVLGLLGLAGMQVRMQQAEFESYQRAQALVLMQDMVDRIQLHRVTAACFRFTNPTSGSPYLGTSANHAAACSASTANDNTEAVTSMTGWNSALLGAAETKGGVAIGAMVGARGCVSYNAASELTDSTGALISGTGIYTVAVAWQGSTDTIAPTVNCANGLYGSAARRRVVSTQFRLPYLR